MKKIIFVIESMNIGGTEKALISMLSEFPQNKYEVTVLLLENYGGFLDYIPSWVKVKILNKYTESIESLTQPPKKIILDEFCNKHILKGISTGLNYCFWRFFNNKYYYYTHQVLKQFSTLPEEYDVAISYQGPPSHFSAYFVSQKIKSKRKIQWIHSDVTKLMLDIQETSMIYSHFDKFYVVSNEAKKNFLLLFPQYEEKTEVFYNIISHRLISEQSKANKGFLDSFKGVRILTVGRLSGEKGQGLTIPVVYRLVKEGYNIRWYCVGDGPMKEEYMKQIQKYGIENHYVLLGASPNPYPFMKECDIYVQPSKFEGYCLTLAEARAFNKPIISTDFVGVHEQLVHNKNGLIIQYNEEQLYQQLKYLIENPSTQQHLEKNLKLEKVDTLNELNKLYEFIDNTN